MIRNSNIYYSNISIILKYVNQEIHLFITEDYHECWLVSLTLFLPYIFFFISSSNSYDFMLSIPPKFLSNSSYFLYLYFSAKMIQCADWVGFICSLYSYYTLYIYQPSCLSLAFMLCNLFTPDIVSEKTLLSLCEKVFISSICFFSNFIFFTSQFVHAHLSFLFY